MCQKKLPQAVSRRVEALISNAGWDEFVDWCLRKDLKPIPVQAWALAAYSLTLEGQMSPTKIRKCLVEIGKIHAAKSKKRPERDALIERTIKVIEKRAKHKNPQAKKLDGEKFLDPTAPKIKTPSPPHTRANGPQAKKQKTRAMRAEPKLVTRRSLK